MHGPEGYNEKSSLLGEQREITVRSQPESIQSNDYIRHDLAWPSGAQPAHTSAWGTFPSSHQGETQWDSQRPRSRAGVCRQTVLAEFCSVGGFMYFLIIMGLVSIGLFLHDEFAQSPPYFRKVAIIGAGPAGASAAYNIRKFAQQEGILVDITLYEKSSYVGGRATCRINFGDESDNHYAVQIAAKGFHASDKNLVDTVNELGLTPVMLDGKKDTDLSGRSGDRWGVFDGSRIVYRQSHPTNFLTGWWWSLKLFFHYGHSPRNTQNTVTSTRSKLRRIYSPRFFPFESLGAVIQDLDLTQETSLTGSQLLSKKNVGIPFQKDLVNAWTRRDFGQNLGQISGLAAMASPDDGGDMTVEGGHWTLFEEMVRASGAEVMFNTTAFGMRKMEWGGWVIATQPANEGDIPQDGDNYQEYDSVILAAPYQLSNLEIKGEKLSYVPDEIEYAPLHITLFRSPRKLSRGYFHHNADVPETMLSTLGGNEFNNLKVKTGVEGVGRVGFYSVTSVKRLERLDTMGVIAEEFLYKIVSPEEVKDDMIYRLLGASPEENEVISWSYRHEWSSAYPQIYPRTEFAELKLDENFWYTGGIEELSSSMELSSLIGANVAKLAVDGWVREGPRGNRPDRRSDDIEEGEETLYRETIRTYLKSRYEETRSEENGSDEQVE